MTEIFDEQRFAALLDLAGPAHALDLAMRLDEDLSRVSQALTVAAVDLDRPKLRETSHVLLAIAGTVGANRLCDLATRLNARVRGDEGGAFSDLLPEIALWLDDLITRVRRARAALTAPS